MASSLACILSNDGSSSFPLHTWSVSLPLTSATGPITDLCPLHLHFQRRKNLINGDTGDWNVMKQIQTNMVQAVLSLQCPTTSLILPVRPVVTGRITAPRDVVSCNLLNPAQALKTHSDPDSQFHQTHTALASHTQGTDLAQLSSGQFLFKGFWKIRELFFSGWWGGEWRENKNGRFIMCQLKVFSFRMGGRGPAKPECALPHLYVKQIQMGKGWKVSV